MTDAFDLPGGPAFPISISGVGDNGCPGMSLRDWFAGMIMAAAFTTASGDLVVRSIAAYQAADAMLLARCLPIKEPFYGDQVIDASAEASAHT